MNDEETLDLVEETPDALDGAAANPEELVVATADDGLPYTVSDWCGLPNYECKYCAYATVKSEQAARDHYFERHVIGRVRTSILVGPNGEQIIVGG